MQLSYWHEPVGPAKLMQPSIRGPTPRACINRKEMLCWLHTAEELTRNNAALCCTAPQVPPWLVPQGPGNYTRCYGILMRSYHNFQGWRAQCGRWGELRHSQGP